MTTEFEIDVDQINQPYWDGLKQGKLLYQSCQCGHRWLPASRHCPSCLSEDSKWVQASGEATIVSWVVYHVAYNPEVKDKLPYNVAIVRLKEGPQLITNIEGDADQIAIGLQVKLKIDQSLSQPLARFSL